MSAPIFAPTACIACLLRVTAADARHRGKSLVGLRIFSSFKELAGFSKVGVEDGVSANSTTSAQRNGFSRGNPHYNKTKLVVEIETSF